MWEVSQSLRKMIMLVANLILFTTALKCRDSRMTSSPLYRHDSTVHNNDIQVYRCTKIASESKLVRLNCNEAIRIERQNESYSMNERNKGGRGGLVRISATRVSSS